MWAWSCWCCHCYTNGHRTSWVSILSLHLRHRPSFRCSRPLSCEGAYGEVDKTCFTLTFGTVLTHIGWACGSRGAQPPGGRIRHVPLQPPDQPHPACWGTPRQPTGLGFTRHRLRIAKVLLHTMHRASRRCCARGPQGIEYGSWAIAKTRQTAALGQSSSAERIEMQTGCHTAKHTRKPLRCLNLCHRFSARAC